jgi:vancomycin permeability regulator SanA
MSISIRPTLSVIGALILALFLATAGFILYSGLSDKLAKSDVAIILGSKINANGEPSVRLKARLDKGIELYKQGYFEHIIVSGGFGKEGFDEATVMKDYLVAHQIPTHVVITDSQGDNTRATAMNSERIMRAHGFKSALVISQYFHIARSRLALQQSGIAPIYTAHANYYDWRDLYATPREVLAYFDYCLFK